MKTALILPTEYCVTADTIKRALLHYDKVLLKNPDDRDFVNSSDMSVLALNMPFRMSAGNLGPSKLLGKEKDYDLKFEKILSEFSLALSEGSLEVMEMPSDIYNRSNVLQIGGSVSKFDYFVCQQYKYMVSDSNFIKAASRGLNRKWLNDNDYDELAPKGFFDTNFIINGQIDNRLSYMGPVQMKYEREVLTRMIHARIASVSRNLALCDLNNFVPFADNIGYSSIIQQIQSNFSEIVNMVNDGSIEIEKLDLISKVEKVIFSDFIDQNKINSLSVKDVLKLRTSMWGKYGECKEEFESTLLKLALDTKDENEFTQKVKTQFQVLLKQNRDYIHERGVLSLKLACNIAPGVIASITKINGLLQNFISAPTLNVLMGIGCAATVIIANNNIPIILNVLKQKNDLEKLPSYNLFKYYKPLLKQN